MKTVTALIIKVPLVYDALRRYLRGQEAWRVYPPGKIWPMRALETVVFNASYIALACLNIINYIIDSRLIDI